MEDKVNWIQGDWLQTHKHLFKFQGQEGGKLKFIAILAQEMQLCHFNWPIKQVTDMVNCGEWKHIKQHSLNAK